MKKLLLCLTLFVATNSLFAQQGINYKAIISDNGVVLQNQVVQVQFTVLNNGVTTEYQETHSTTTDDNGIIIVNIGEGTVVNGLYNSIQWNNPQYLKVEIDTGSGYVDFGTTEFKTVPYAIYAENGNGAKELNDLSDAKSSDDSSVFLGKYSGIIDDSTGNQSTGIGTYTLRYNTTGFGNTATGTYSLFSNTSGNRNTASGHSSLYTNTTGFGNTAFGDSALYNITDGVGNTALGHQSGYNNSGNLNIFLGHYAGYNETGSNKLYIENTDSTTPLIGGDFLTDEVTVNGSISILDGTEGVNKVLTSDADGKASWQTLDTSGVTKINELSDGISDDSSVFLGQNSGINDDASDNLNTGIGVNTLTNNTTGYANNAIGFSALSNNTNGDSNIAIGYSALLDNTSGSGNSAFGTSALHGNTTGNFNVALGHSSGYNSNGTYNVFMGYRAGYSATGNSNIFIGHEAGTNETGSNKLYIENSTSSTPLIGGDFSTNVVDINGQLAVTSNISAATGYIGDAGYSRFTVDGSTVNSELVRFKANNITSGSDVLDLEIPIAPSAGTSQFIEANTANTTVFKVDHTGDVYTKGELHGENSGDADMKALVYGYVDADTFGTYFLSDLSSDGFTVAIPQTGRYHIFITGETTNNFVPIVTCSSTLPRIIVSNYGDSSLASGAFEVRIYDLSGNLVQDTFTFVVYKK